MTKGFTRNKQRNIEHGDFKVPIWLIDRSVPGSPSESINGVYLDHLEKVADEDDVYECHLYNLGMGTLDKLLEGCKKKGIRMTVKAYSEYNPGNTIAIRLERIDSKEEEEDEGK
jgi:hypothetical protein